MKNTTNATTATINATTLLDCIISNQKFASRRVNAEQISADSLKAWHALLDSLLVDAYKVASDAHNGNNAKIDSVYATLGKVWAIFPTLPNGAKLRNDSDSALTMLAFSSTEKNKYSADYLYKKSQINLEKTFIRQNTQEDGVTPLNGMEQSVQSHLDTIEDLEAEFEELKAVENSVVKHTTRVSKSAFYKKVEDYIAEKALDLFAKTNEEIQAEEEARKAERNKKANARKAAKKAESNK